MNLNCREGVVWRLIESGRLLLNMAGCFYTADQYSLRILKPSSQAGIVELHHVVLIHFSPFQPATGVSINLYFEISAGVGEYREAYCCGLGWRKQYIRPTYHQDTAATKYRPKATQRVRLAHLHRHAEIAQRIIQARL